MGKIQEATDRMFRNIFVCKRCHNKMRTEPQKILQGKVKCRKCNAREFRPIRKK